MKNLQAYRNQLKELESLIDQLENGELDLDGLLRLEQLTGELHRKSIILRYKAFEEHSGVQPTLAPEPSPEEAVKDAPVVEAPPVEPVDETPDIDFSIFDEVEPEEPEEPATMPEPEPVVEPVPEPEAIRPEPVIEPVPEPEPEAPKSEEPVKEAPKKEVSFWEQINVEDNSLGSRFAGAKLDTLIGAFGLNEKLRYINDLFDGSSEMFSDAVKLLDTQPGLEEARVKVDELAREHSWDPEEEAVVEFMTYVTRRYA